VPKFRFVRHMKNSVTETCEGSGGLRFYYLLGGCFVFFEGGVMLVLYYLGRAGVGHAHPSSYYRA
jgi:hypothetical protein